MIRGKRINLKHRKLAEVRGNLHKKRGIIFFKGITYNNTTLYFLDYAVWCEKRR